MRLYLTNLGTSLWLTTLPLAASAALGQATHPSSAPASTNTSGLASAPATAPVAAEGSEWQQTLEQLADQLSNQNLKGVHAIVGRDPLVRNFASDAASSVERLVGATAQAKLIGTHAYPQVPATLAGDLANDFQGAGELVPEQTRKDMQPADEHAAKRANETAASWIAQVLQPKKDQVVGVMVFWPTERRAPTDTSARRAIFVLVKAQWVKGAYVVQQVTFGDPLETPR